MRIPGSLRQVAMPRASMFGGTFEVLDLMRWATQGFRFYRESVELYHREIANHLGIDVAFSYGAGRHALIEILKALGVGQGDEVILPGFTCIVVPAAIRQLGAVPIYADIAHQTLNIDPKLVPPLISKRTKVILAQHTFGIPCDVGELARISDAHGIYLVEDCAHALGAKIDDKYCGNFGIAAFFSTDQTKMFSTIRGGIAVTNDKSLASRLSASYSTLPDQPQSYQTGAVVRWCRHVLETHPRVGGISTHLLALARHVPSFHMQLENSRNFDADENNAAQAGRVSAVTKLSGPLAAIGIIQLRRLERDVQNRNTAADRILPIASELGWEVPRSSVDKARPSYVRFPALVDSREKWIELLSPLGIEVGQWLNHPLHPLGSNFYACGYQTGMCPNAEVAAQRIINIPIHSRCAKWIPDRLEMVKSKH